MSGSQKKYISEMKILKLEIKSWNKDADSYPELVSQWISEYVEYNDNLFMLGCNEELGGDDVEEIIRKIRRQNVPMVIFSKPYVNYEHLKLIDEVFNDSRYENDGIKKIIYSKVPFYKCKYITKDGGKTFELFDKSNILFKNIQLVVNVNGHHHFDHKIGNMIVDFCNHCEDLIEKHSYGSKLFIKSDGCMIGGRYVKSSEIILGKSSE